MSLGKRSDKKTYPGTWRELAAATEHDLVALSPDGATCPEKLVLPLGGSFTKLVDIDGNDRPIASALPAGYVHNRDVQVANCSAVFLAYY